MLLLISATVARQRRRMMPVRETSTPGCWPISAPKSTDHSWPRSTSVAWAMHAAECGPRQRSRARLLRFRGAIGEHASVLGVELGLFGGADGLSQHSRNGRAACFAP